MKGRHGDGIVARGGRPLFDRNKIPPAMIPRRSRRNSLLNKIFRLAMMPTASSLIVYVFGAFPT
jgi:hypothetical protein